MRLLGAEVHEDNRDRLEPEAPGRNEPLVDIMYFYIGDELEWEVELAIPAKEIEPVRLSKFGQLGWTTWIGTDPSPDRPAYRSDARFHPAERMRQRRQEAFAA